MNKEEVVKHWLLDVAVELPVWLYDIIPNVKDVKLNVRPIPRCGAQDYATGLLELYHSGAIVLSSEFPEDDATSPVGVQKIIERFLTAGAKDQQERPGEIIRANRTPKMAVKYGLTALGGASWEKIAEPNWMRFVNSTSDAERGELISANRDLLLAYMGWYSYLNEEEIETDTIEWEHCSDLNVLYWKQLPFAYRVSFGVKSTDVKWMHGMPKWFQEWHLSLFSWYTKTWQLRDWSSLTI